MSDWCSCNPLKEAQKKAASLVGVASSYNRMLREACKMIADMSGTCPYDHLDHQPRNCDSECGDDYAECWLLYFLDMETKSDEED